MNRPRSRKCRKWREVSVFIMMVFLFFGMMVQCLAQESKIDINALTQETQKMSQKADEMSFVWWIPEEFWRVSFSQDPTVTEAQAEEFIKVLQPYTIVVVVDGKIGAFGGVTYKSEETIRADLQIKDSRGTFYSPFTEDKIDADTKNFLSMMKPILENMLGPMGQNMHFYLFPGKDKENQKIADAKKEGAFSVKLGQREFRWKLPLSTLFPPKICPNCKEELSGAYKFCPWDGTKLP